MEFKTALALLASGAVSAAAGLCGYLFLRKSTKKKYHSEVIIFPDRRLDVDESRAEKVLKFRDILGASRPQQRLISHLEGATKSIDLCVYLITSEGLAEVVLSQIKEKKVRVRLIVDDTNVGIIGSQVREGNIDDMYQVVHSDPNRWANSTRLGHSFGPARPTTSCTTSSPSSTGRRWRAAPSTGRCRPSWATRRTSS